jgi:SAM-dependent methyltransferase
MAAPAPSIITRVAYGVSRLPRVAWYLGHGLALRLAEAARRNNGAKARRRDRSRLYADMARLFLNFHFQSCGWLTDESAERYDTQVEVLRNGTANAMRRQALPQLHELFAGRDQRQLRLLDIGCGTGRFLDSVKQAWPRLHIVGLDMSDAYVRYAKRHLRCRPRTSFVIGKAEAIPVADASQDDHYRSCRDDGLPTGWPRSLVCHGFLGSENYSAGDITICVAGPAAWRCWRRSASLRGAPRLSNALRSDRAMEIAASLARDKFTMSLIEPPQRTRHIPGHL